MKQNKTSQFLVKSWLIGHEPIKFDKTILHNFTLLLRYRNKKLGEVLDPTKTF